MDDKISLVTFTDPMMGLSYECEPIFRKLETHFAGRIEFYYIMSLLVRDVYELVDPDDLKFGKEVAIKNYNAKLAEIYRFKSQGALAQNLIGYETFAKIFSDLSGGEIKPVPPQKNIETLQDILKIHPLISHIELREAFDFVDTAQIRNFISPLVDSGEIKIINVPRGYFIQKI